MKNFNTERFWNNKIKHERSLLETDPMTIDRIRTAYKFLPLKKEMKILDIGAGYGFIEELLSRNENIEIYGNDISGAAIDDLRERFKGNFKKESIYNMNYKNEYFDVIFALEILEHIPKNKIIILLKKIRKIIKRNGSLIISIPINEGLNLRKGNPNAHLREYTEEVIQKELAEAGFKILKIERLVAFNSFYHFKNLIRKVFKNKWKPNNLVILSKPI